jgi:hypothetical protein
MRGPKRDGRPTDVGASVTQSRWTVLAIRDGTPRCAPRRFSARCFRLHETHARVQEEYVPTPDRGRARATSPQAVR